MTGSSKSLSQLLYQMLKSTFCLISASSTSSSAQMAKNSSWKSMILLLLSAPVLWSDLYDRMLGFSIDYLEQ